MQTTTDKLERMEPAPFEQLSGESLRHLYPLLRHLIPTGINSQGKTIVSPFDGFCLIETNHFVMFQATTNGSNLRAKWLSTAKEKGDLIKSIHEAEIICKQYSDYRFTVYLVSNRQVDQQLHIDVATYNTDTIKTVVVEQRELVPFLDHNAEGQYLRKKYLGIDADRISDSLLKEIARDNLRRYADEIYLDENSIAILPRYDGIETQVSQSRLNVNLLIGESGFGKSTLAFALLLNAQNEGRISMRIKPNCVELANSVEDAIYRQLLDESPKIYVDPHAIPELFNAGLIVFDDINKSPNAAVLLDKIISWSVAREQSFVNIVCPVWPRNLNALDNFLKKESRVHSVRVNRLTFNECKAIIGKRVTNNNLQLTDQQVHSLIIDTGFDPLLLDISLDLIKTDQPYSGTTATEAISNFVNDKIKQLHSRYQYPISAIREALIQLGMSMLQHARMDIQLSDINEWISGNGNDIIVKAAAERQLFFFDEEGKCFFRHDRVRDHLLTMALAEMLSDFGKHQNVLA
jgi:ABC-type oligopeptide transport system ATPase subunit